MFHRIDPSDRARVVDVVTQFDPHVVIHVAVWEPDARVNTATAKRLTGLERFHVHQMRYTYACDWVNRGGSVAALQQILGHASIQTTQRYARISDEMVWRENERLFGKEVAKEVASNS